MFNWRKPSNDRSSPTFRSAPGRGGRVVGTRKGRLPKTCLSGAKREHSVLGSCPARAVDVCVRAIGFLMMLMFVVPYVRKWCLPIN